MEGRDEGSTTEPEFMERDAGVVALDCLYRPVGETMHNIEENTGAVVQLSP